jgi:major membrane immunogen (membrane-anchored lipoprotein)
MKTLPLLLLTTIFSSLLFLACSKNDSSTTKGKAKMQVYLTDGPGDYEAVYIDVQDIWIMDGRACLMCMQVFMIY